MSFYIHQNNNAFPVGGGYKPGGSRKNKVLGRQNR